MHPLHCCRKTVLLGFLDRPLWLLHFLFFIDDRTVSLLPFDFHDSYVYPRRFPRSRPFFLVTFTGDTPLTTITAITYLTVLFPCHPSVNDVFLRQRVFLPTLYPLSKCRLSSDGEKAACVTLSSDRDIELSELDITIMYKKSSNLTGFFRRK